MLAAVLITGVALWWPVIPIVALVVVAGKLRAASRKLDTILAEELGSGKS